MKLIRKHTHAALSLVVAALIINLASTANAASTSVADIELPKLKQPTESVYTGGQPSKEQIKQLAETGVKHIVNLRPETEMDWDEKAYVEDLGLNYHHLPIGGASDITEANAKRFAEIVASLEGKDAYIHCASGNRVGALAAYQAHLLHAMPKEKALEHGREWGMTRLEPIVADKLSKRDAKQ